MSLPYVSNSSVGTVTHQELLCNLPGDQNVIKKITGLKISIIIERHGHPHPASRDTGARTRQVNFGSVKAAVSGNGAAPSPLGPQGP